ncbi:retrovirus-related Pol polyprotein from transposon 412 [Trichonephila inaurata madagascariensis]|uniref:Retrovirus-related Pol polyprotein from transposon 412 n=1 Tax=Trichonephila inaurata madagascariensis TaxID=2747483 RepID=A0A8X6YL55_9ARAC|nr:retrovirus-related Pol polyprotein from transposon 412 [Trichonephila inaurata madagascariensis]
MDWVTYLLAVLPAELSNMLASEPTEWANNYDFVKDFILKRTPLEESLICLPLAEVELDCEMGHVITKAVVLRDSLDQGRYLLGNKTAALLEDYKTKEYVQMYMINAVQTGAQKKLLEVENEAQGQSIEQFNEELNDDLSEDEKKTIEKVLPVVKELSVQDLINTSPKVLVEEQHKSEQLKPLIADAKLNVSKENKYVLEKNMLFFKKRNKNGTERKLLVVPEKFREQLKTFCHEEPGCTNLTEHDIELESDRPICARHYRLSPRQSEILRAEVEKMLRLNVIEKGESDFTSPLIIVEAPGKEARPCIHYRRLNKVTRTKFFPLQNIEELMQNMHQLWI